MDDNGANIIRVSFELGNLLGSVIVVDSKLEVIATNYYPVLSRDKTAGSDGDISRLEGFDDSLWKTLEYNWRSVFRIRSLRTCVSNDQI